MIQIEETLFSDIVKCFNHFPNTKVNGLVNGKNSYEIISKLEQAEKGKIFVCGWSIDDIQTVVDEMNEEIEDHWDEILLTDEEKTEILKKIESEFDAECGICWDTIRDAVNEYLSVSKKVK